MFSKFMTLNPEKQDRILNAALKEFALKGYQNASTNEIVKEAGISKGLLFHYFNNKKDLYLFLFDYFMELLMDEIQQRVDWNEKDIFARYKQVGMIKFELFSKYPNVFGFIKTIRPEVASEVKPDLELRQKQFLDKGYKDIFSGLDFSSFKEGIDIEKALSIIYWTMEGFAYKQQDKVAAITLEDYDVDEMMAEMDTYCEMLRIAFYK
ncbi:TetR/AcrR family transcriptional regulator [Paenibacillus sp. sgz500958]|uniref:TetR/AcrR family transcriptional regulator n=1 Tax=Paenibacillus sp. sgz500958 TaxID=3242475 RepID=UPI0036D354B6